MLLLLYVANAFNALDTPCTSGGHEGVAGMSVGGCGQLIEGGGSDLPPPCSLHLW